MRHYILYVIFISIIPLFGCQTIHKNDNQLSKQQEILASQKGLIVNYLNKSVPSMALKELRRLMRLHPKDADFQNLMGLTQLAMENPSKASKYFKNSYKINPRTSVALNLSSAYIEDGKFLKAIQLLKKVNKDKVSENYQYPERIFHNIALAAERNRNHRQAVKYYQVALSENPNYYLSLMRLGQLYEKSKRPLDAQKTFVKAKNSCPKCFDPVNALAMGFIAKGKHRSAFRVLKRYARKNEISDENRMKAKKLIVMVKKIARSRPNPNKKGKLATSKTGKRKSQAQKRGPRKTRATTF